MPPGANIIQISAGYRHTCAALASGQAFCWGVGQYGRLGNNSLSNQSTPTEVYRGDPPRVMTTTETIHRLNTDDIILY